MGEKGIAAGHTGDRGAQARKERCEQFPVEGDVVGSKDRFAGKQSSCAVADGVG